MNPGAVGPAVVIGVGNDFRRDDGAGPAVVEALRAMDGLPADVRLVCCDGEPARMIDLWHGAGLAIVVDAAYAEPGSGTPPGTVLRWEPSRLDDETEPGLNPDGGGSHALGPGSALRLARVLGRVPARLLVFAVVGEDFGPGPGLSDPVSDAVRRTAEEILTELRRQGRLARFDGDLGPCSAAPSPETLVS